MYDDLKKKLESTVKINKSNDEIKKMKETNEKIEDIIRKSDSSQKETQANLNKNSKTSLVIFYQIRPAPVFL